ncbi:hypothetical protein CHU98_g6072 [Xylaria longipes]|nr:hypothetical protein CHU98_g6072 [Xylaria longipes]
MTTAEPDHNDLKHGASQAQKLGSDLWREDQTKGPQAYLHELHNAGDVQREYSTPTLAMTREPIADAELGNHEVTVASSRKVIGRLSRLRGGLGLLENFMPIDSRPPRTSPRCRLILEDIVDGIYDKHTTGMGRSKMRIPFPWKTRSGPCVRVGDMLNDRVWGLLMSTSSVITDQLHDAALSIDMPVSIPPHGGRVNVGNKSAAMSQQNWTFSAIKRQAFSDFLVRRLAPVSKLHVELALQQGEQAVHNHIRQPANDQERLSQNVSDGWYSNDSNDSSALWFTISFCGIFGPHRYDLLITLSGS